LDIAGSPIKSAVAAEALAPADYEGDPEAARPDRSALGALPDDAADHPRARTADAADPAAVPNDPRARSGEAQADDARDAALA
jgi:hypothetical protein